MRHCKFDGFGGIAGAGRTIVRAERCGTQIAGKIGVVDGIGERIAASLGSDGRIHGIIT